MKYAFLYLFLSGVTTMLPAAAQSKRFQCVYGS